MTDRLLKMKAWDSDLEEEERLQCGEKDASNGTTDTGEKSGREDKMDTQSHLQKVQKLIYAAKVFVIVKKDIAFGVNQCLHWDGITVFQKLKYLEIALFSLIKILKT